MVSLHPVEEPTNQLLRLRIGHRYLVSDKVAPPQVHHTDTNDLSLHFVKDRLNGVANVRSAVRWMLSDLEDVLVQYTGGTLPDS